VDPRIAPSLLDPWLGGGDLPSLQRLCFPMPHWRKQRAYRQVFWLPDLSTPCAFPSLKEWIVASEQVSSPVTAAGPRRPYTGFPFKPRRAPVGFSRTHLNTGVLLVKGKTPSRPLPPIFPGRLLPSWSVWVSIYIQGNRATAEFFRLQGGTRTRPEPSSPPADVWAASPTGGGAYARGRFSAAFLRREAGGRRKRA
jgi:hypothetical protein